MGKELRFRQRLDESKKKPPPILPPELLAEAEKIGARLARLRIARHISQTDAALRAGFSRNTAYRFLGVGRSGRLATLDNALTAKEMFNLSEREAAAAIAHVCEKVREWKTHFETFGASAKSIDQAAGAYRHIDQISTPKLRALLP